MLEQIERDHRVAIPLAIESGSRAWGFPSPDSDFDCRFIFVRTASACLTPWPERDVIELPPDGVYDVNGWDLAKALRLMLKGNAVVVEWLMSPIGYQMDEAFRRDMLALAARHGDRAAIMRHYLHLGIGQRRTYPGEAVPLKKLFYALRPAAALRWLRLHPADRIAPMHFPQLVSECDPPSVVLSLIADLVARKAETRELGTGPVPPEIAAFIDHEFAYAANQAPAEPDGLRAEARADASALFRRWVTRLDPSAATR